MARFLVLLVLFIVYINCAVLRGKAFYCRDPDTGKLHAVNTTWTASSFCGNYTCNLRKRNLSSSVVPIRQFNITNVEIEGHEPEVTEKVTVTIQKKTEPDILTLLHKSVSPDPRNVVDNSLKKNINIIPPADYSKQDNTKPKENNCKMGQKLQDESDRYLTEKEIESIAEMLHTVKRSDLDAIIDIYNLAQDVYKEIDETTSDEIKKEALGILKEEDVKEEAFKVIKEADIHTNHDVKTSSYWYDPLASKGRTGETYDINLHNALNIITTEKPVAILSDNYNEKLITDMEKTSIYYPVTQFQRISSYIHPTHPSYRAEIKNMDIKSQSNLIKVVKNINKNENYKADSQKLIQPSNYLPYPFTNIHPYNLTESRNIYYGSPWMLDYYNRYKYYQPYYNTYIGPVQKAVLINPHLHNEVQDVEQQNVVEQPLEIKKQKTLNEDMVDKLLKGQLTPSWKTDPVPIDVLKDIRADIDTSRLLKAFPLRKKIKLERVGKLMNLDDLNSHVNNRNKRLAIEMKPTEKATEHSTNVEVGEYETYLERVTCQDQIKLGYFRIGNLSQPFPECCPQLIDTR